MLDELGVDYVEGGYPGANPLDTEFFKNEADAQRALLRLRHDEAPRPLGRQRSRASRACSPPTPTRSSSSPRPGTITSMSRSAARSTKIWTPSRDSVTAAVAAGREAMVDCEHFFDGYKANPALRAACARTLDRGRRALGRALRHQRRHAAARGRAHRRGSRARVPGEQLGIHAHNDTDNAVANSLAAVRAGVRQMQGTLNGLGERCGNANLVSLIPTLALKQEFADRFEIGVTPEMLWRLTSISPRLRRIAEPRAQSPRALCRRLGLRDQGGHPRFRARQGSAHLRACDAGERRQPARDPRLRSGGPVESCLRNSSALGVDVDPERSAPRRACSTR